MMPIQSIQGSLAQKYDKSNEHKDIFLCVRWVHHVLCGLSKLWFGYSYISIGDITVVINS